MSGGYCAHVWSMRRQRWYEVGTRGGAAAFVSLVVMLSAGCGSLDPNRATDERTSSSTSYAAWRPSRPVTGQTMSAQQLADYYRGEFIPALDTKDVPAPPPEVQPVRWVYFEEVGTEVAKCLREEGFDANPTVGGRGVSVQFGNASQQSAFALANYICEASYPVDPRVFPSAWSLDQKEAAYEYLTTWLIPCLREHGVEAAAAPSLEVHASDPTTAWTYPDLGGQSAMQEMLTACPSDPPGAAITGG